MTSSATIEFEQTAALQNVASETRGPSQGVTPESKVASGIFFGLLAGYTAWILALPAFPTQDGPVHLYYAKILWGLISGDATYSRYFYVQHWLPPYALHMYVLLALTKLFPPLLAEKVMTVLTVGCFAWGAYFLMKAVRRSEPILAAFLVPLSLNWALFMGFFNYVLALGLMFFAIGAWFRACDSGSRKMYAAYLGFLVAIALTHSVPLLMALIVCGGDFLIRIAVTVRNKRPLRELRDQITVSVLSCIPALYITRFMKSSADATAAGMEYHAKLTEILRGMFVSPFRGRGFGVFFHNVGIELLVAFCICAGIIRCLRCIRKRSLWGTEALFITALGFFLSVPWLPFTANGGYFLGPRFAIAGALLLVVAGNAALVWSRTSKRVFLALGLVAGVAALPLFQSRIGPVARDVASVPSFSTPDRHGVTMFAGSNRFSGIRFNPYYWVGARSYMNGDAVILNSPWMFSPFSMLGSKPPVLNYSVANDPIQVLLLMQFDESFLKQIQSASDAEFVIARDPKTREIARLLALSGAKASCQSTDWYEMCVKDETGVPDSSSQVARPKN